ncbi:hypothetical protein [Tolypothrix sp. NIES-4075]|uniref:hypothetical protein n=1 Tax=Tolypothrix sp. NIES-4075 TaxID=2005459 RepID=UPI000B5CDC4A|nr:hypothetical protein [Tolypothrix sp. NIES-4075]
MIASPKHKVEAIATDTSYQLYSAAKIIKTTIDSFFSRIGQRKRSPPLNRQETTKWMHHFQKNSEVPTNFSFKHLLKVTLQLPYSLNL